MRYMTQKYHMIQRGLTLNHEIYTFLILSLFVIGCDKVKDVGERFLSWTDDELIDNQPKSNKDVIKEVNKL